MRKAILEGADELMCRVSNQKIDLFTQLGKVILPTGYWGTKAADEHCGPHVYMTFDDGPHPATTPYLLELLAQNGIHATFFLIGANCARYKDLVLDIYQAGHLIGNHSYNHLPVSFMSGKQMQHELQSTNAIIEEITGFAPTIFRPPFGIIDVRAAKCLKDNGLTPVYWSSAPEDWLIPGSQRVIRRVMWKVTDGALIVLHEGGLLAGQTITAAKEIIYRCKTLGYQFSKVNVSA